MCVSFGNPRERRTIVSRTVFACRRAFAFHRSSGHGFTRLVTAALLAVLAGVVVIDGAAAKDWPPAGGSRRRSKAAKGKPGGYLVRVKVKSGARGDQMDLIWSAGR